MGVFAIAFIAHTYETAFAVRAPHLADSAQGNLRTKTFDYTRTEKVARVATAMMILGFLLLFAGVIARGISAGRVPWGNMYEFSITGARSPFLSIESKNRNAPAITFASKKTPPEIIAADT